MTQKTSFCSLLHLYLCWLNSLIYTVDITSKVSFWATVWINEDVSGNIVTSYLLVLLWPTLQQSVFYSEYGTSFGTAKLKMQYQYAKDSWVGMQKEEIVYYDKSNFLCPKNRSFIQSIALNYENYGVYQSRL